MTLGAAQARSRPGCIEELQSVLRAQVDEEMLRCPVKRAALAVLWASYNVQESGLSVASSLGEAAGLQGRHQWGLILPSSARESLVTYQTVIAVRYPDLVHTDSGVVSYEMFFSARRWLNAKLTALVQQCERLPDSWSMARLAITLDGLTAQLRR